MGLVVRKQISFDGSFFGDKASRAFRQFHVGNPRVFKELVRLAKEAKSRGYKHYAINTLFEVMRWHISLETTDPDFKLNNNYRAYYARLIMRFDPDLRGFFRIRQSRADEL